MTTLNILIGGPAGSGIESAGQILGQALNRSGASVVVTNEIMSQIRGGHNFNKVRFSYAEKVFAHEWEVDIVMALDRMSVADHLDEIKDGGLFIFDESINVQDLISEELRARGVEFLPIKLEASIKDLGGDIYKNVLMIGTILGLTGIDPVFVEKVIKDKFGNKGVEIIENNLKALKKGLEMAGRQRFQINTTRKDSSAKMLLNGNDAVCLGAVKSGCKFVAEYPMTPSSSVLHTMASWAKSHGIVVKHAEDEIAAMNMIVGAGFAGARAMTATSGGGFALMTEACGMAGCSETPCVVVEAMRAGPSTGLPTKTEQGDLRQVLHASQGEYPRLVMVPGDVKECFDMGFEAFNYAEKYQIPVFVLTDKYLSETYVNIEPFNVSGLALNRGKLLDEKTVETQSENGFYKRYADSQDGISGRALPGTAGGCHVSTSYEHDEFGDLIEDAPNRILQVEKRMRKMTALKSELPPPVVDGEGDGDMLFVSLGSMKSVLQETVSKLKGRNKNAHVLLIQYLIPFHSEEIKSILEKYLNAGKKVVLVEQNFTAQLGGIIAENTGILLNEKILKYDGFQMDSEYILNKLA